MFVEAVAAAAAAVSSGKCKMLFLLNMGALKTNCSSLFPNVCCYTVSDGKDEAGLVSVNTI